MRRLMPAGLRHDVCGDSATPHLYRIDGRCVSGSLAAAAWATGSPFSPSAAFLAVYALDDARALSRGAAWQPRLLVPLLSDFWSRSACRTTWDSIRSSGLLFSVHRRTRYRLALRDRAFLPAIAVRLTTIFAAYLISGGLSTGSAIAMVALRTPVTLYRNTARTGDRDIRPAGRTRGLSSYSSD